MHPEDLEHFAHHEHIEKQEAEREAKFQGITVDEALAQHEPHPEGEAPPPSVEEGEHAQQPLADFGGEKVESSPQATIRAPDDPVERFKKAKAAGGNEQWGEGEGGYKAPKTPGERYK